MLLVSAWWDMSWVEEVRARRRCEKGWHKTTDVVLKPWQWSLGATMLAPQ